MSNYELIIYHGAGSVTYTASNSSRIVDRQLEWHENYPKILRLVYDNADPVASQNILDSTCAIWTTGTGALELGDEVKYSDYPTSTGSKTEEFYGKITKLKRDPKTGYLNIEARDFLEYYEAEETGRILYKNYRDSLAGALAYDFTNQWWEIGSISDPDILLPLVKLEVTANKEALTIATTQNGDSPHLPVAQAFFPTKPLFMGVYFQVKADSTPCTINISLREDDGGDPAVVSLWSENYTFSGTIYEENSIEVDYPVEMVVGGRYWIMFDAISGGDSCVGVQTTPTYGLYPDYKYASGGWQTQTDDNLDVVVGLAEWTDIPESDYEYVPASTEVRIYQLPSGTKGIDYVVWPFQIFATYEAKLHYYYNKHTLEDIFRYLLEMSPAGPVITSSVSTDIGRTLHIYRTQGKSIGDCLRELADVFETSGTYPGRQHVFRHYKYGAYQNVTVRFRYKTSDTSAFTFSHGRDSSTDDEVRVIDADLEKDAKQQISGVTVIGKSPDGHPICAHRDDRALTTSIRNKVGFPYSISHTDDNLQTLADADVSAYAILDAGKRDVWEGSITVSGVYPDVETDYTVTGYGGSGKIITLNYSPLGIADKFKVTGYISHPNKTQIFLTNRDFLKENFLTKAITKAELSNAFQSPEDLQTNVYYPAFVDSVVTTATLYMELSKSENVAIDGSTRVLCTKLANTDYNLNVYHAEFEADNGYTIDGTSLVAWINLYDAASGGSKIAGFNVPSYDEFPKWKTTRIIVDLLCKASS